MQKFFRRKLFLSLVMMLILVNLPGTLFTWEHKVHAAGFAGGTGTISDPYQIADADQLNEVRNHLEAGKYFKLVADIDLSSYVAGNGWVPIGSPDNRFKGNLDGNGFEITNLTINKSDGKYLGLFGASDKSSKLFNVALKNVQISGDSIIGGLVALSYGNIINCSSDGTLASKIGTVGGLVGEVLGGAISNSHARGTVDAGFYDAGGLVGSSDGLAEIISSYAEVHITSESQVGGLVGVNRSAYIISSFAKGNVTGGSRIGGLIGDNYGQIIDSHATGEVVSSGFFIGGLIGYNQGWLERSYATGNVNGRSEVGGLSGVNSGLITNSYSSGNVNGRAIIGGLVGTQKNTTIKNSYAVGNVSGDYYTGGLIGYIDSTYDSPTVSNSYYDLETTGQSDTGKGEGKSTAEMNNATTYSDWDLSDIWTINLENNGYPYLRPLLYKVTYDGNGNTSGSVPVDNNIYSWGVIASVYGNTGNLEKTGYTFSGWSHSKSANLFPLQENETFTIMGNRTLYANWLSQNSHLRGVNLDNGILSPAFSPSNLNYTVNVDHTVQALNFNVLHSDWDQRYIVTGAEYIYNPNGLTYVASNLTEGPNVVKITVTAPDRVTTSEYTLTINRQRSDSGSGGNNGGGGSGGGSGSSGGGGGAAGNGAGSTATACPTGTITSTDGSLSLSNCGAGEVSLEGEVSLSVSSDSVGKDDKLKIDKVSNTQSIVSDLALASSVFEISKSSPESFSKPVKLTIQLQREVAGCDQTASIFHYDEGKKEWSAVADSQLNGNQIFADVRSQGKYTVFIIDQNTGLPVKESDVTVKPNFSDIAGHWAEVNIVKSACGDIVNGYPNGTFQPNQSVTRAEFTVMLMNALNLQAEADVSFTDEESIGSWAKAAAAQAVQAGIITGYPDDSFRPQTEITRIEMAMMIARALKVPSVSKGSTSFADDKDIPEWAKGAVEAIKQLGLIKGQGNNIFAPHASATRAETVTVLQGLLALNTDN